MTSSKYFSKQQISAATDYKKLAGFDCISAALVMFTFGNGVVMLTFGDEVVTLTFGDEVAVMLHHFSSSSV